MSNRCASKRIWMSWEKHRRNRTTSNAVGAVLYEIDGRARGIWRYIRSSVVTLSILLREKPELVFAQNPSIVLTMVVLLFSRISRVPVVIDAHNAGLRPLEGRNRWLNGLARYAIRSAALTIVTNQGLAEYVAMMGGKPAVLPDPLPELARVTERRSLRGKVNILFVCTWAADEPYVEVIRAASRLDKSVVIYISGNSRGKEQAYGEVLPENVVLTGYLPEEQYEQLLNAVDIVIDLTLRDDCLVCGAYEGVAAGKPLILSGTTATRQYFTKGVLYTDNSADDIGRQIALGIEKLNELSRNIVELKGDLNSGWQQMKADLEQQISLIMSEDETRKHRRALP